MLKKIVFEKINKICKPPARLRKKERRHKLLISEMKEGPSLITTNPMDIKNTVKGYYEQLDSHKFDNLDEKD